ncbi:MAG: Gfo/Idh/MocA family oxidoreductase [Dongiaceae bacterium]
MINVGLIGYGHWGPKLARCLAAADDVALTSICDLSADRLALAAAAHPRARLAADWRELVADPRTDAVAVATPAASHAEIALAALRQGKHVLVEKPMARSVAEARALVEESRRRERVLLVDHTFLFSPAVAAIRDLLAAGTLGEPSLVDAVRLGPGIVRGDVNVVWDLAVHDLSILQHVLPRAPRAVQARGLTPGGGLAQIAHLALHYEGPLLAQIRVSWRAPVKTRRMTIRGTRAVLAYDDLDPRAKIQVAEGAGRPPWSPPLAEVEPLAAVVAHFADCIASGRTPLSGGEAGLAIVGLAEAACQSLSLDGRPVELAGAETAAA